MAIDMGISPIKFMTTISLEEKSETVWVSWDRYEIIVFKFMIFRWISYSFIFDQVFVQKIDLYLINLIFPDSA